MHAGETMHCKPCYNWELIIYINLYNKSQQMSPVYIIWDEPYYDIT